MTMSLITKIIWCGLANQNHSMTNLFVMNTFFIDLGSLFCLNVNFNKHFAFWSQLGKQLHVPVY